MKKTDSFLVLVLILWSFVLQVSAQKTGPPRFSLLNPNDSLYLLQLIENGDTDIMALPYPVYRFTTGDVDGDGREEALVGVEKSTRYDKVVRRRLFVFKNYHGKVRPQWMGSRLGHPIIDFAFVKDKVRSLEAERDGRYLVAEYFWRSFGFDFSSYLCREKDREHAIEVFNQ